MRLYYAHILKKWWTDKPLQWQSCQQFCVFTYFNWDFWELLDCIGQSRCLISLTEGRSLEWNRHFCHCKCSPPHSQAAGFWDNTMPLTSLWPLSPALGKQTHAPVNCAGSHPAPCFQIPCPRSFFFFFYKQTSTFPVVTFCPLHCWYGPRAGPIKLRLFLWQVKSLVGHPSKFLWGSVI